MFLKRGKEVIRGKALCNREDAPAVARTNWMWRGSVRPHLDSRSGWSGCPRRKKDGGESAVKRIRRFNWAAREKGEEEAHRCASITPTKYLPLK